MKLADVMQLSADFAGPGALALPVHHRGVAMTRTQPKVHLRKQGKGMEDIRGDASPSDFNRTHLWEEPSATDVTQQNWRAKRQVEKDKGRNLELYELFSAQDADEVTGPCGCTLKLGEQAIVEGGFRGIITHRNNRVLTVAMGDGMKLQVDQKFVHRIAAAGTSEGAKKGWEVRSRAQITEYYPGSKGRGTRTVYSYSGNGQPTSRRHLSNYDVRITQTAKRARVEEHGTYDGDNHITTVHEGNPDSAKAFVKKHYGIDHTPTALESWNPEGRSFSQRPAEAYRDLTAYGTSEGVSKAWEIRKAGGGQEEDEAGKKEGEELQRWTTWKGKYLDPIARGINEVRKKGKTYDVGLGRKIFVPSRHLGAAGTSEGVKKAWDTRGRKGPQNDPNWATRASHRKILKSFGYQRPLNYRHTWTKGDNTVSLSPTGAWMHYKKSDSDKPINHGDRPSELKDHLQKFHGE